nr:exophilin-5 isoform X1 [Anolis sagrei ordinatus]
MNRAPRGVDLSFLSKEEAQQIFQVLERDSQLKRAEKERLSKLNKKREDSTELPGVTGEWFQEIQRTKFQNDSDAGRMSKQPFAHRLRKVIGNDSANTKPLGPQKHASPSILGGLRTPFASLFSSFRRSKRQQHPKPQQNPQEYPSRYDHFVAGARMSSKVEEMAKTETCDAPLPSEPTKKYFETNQTEMLDDSSCTWSEQLENELLKVLGNLDEQLAQEQSREVNKRTQTHYGSKAPEISHHPSVTQHSYHGGVQRNERSMFLSDGVRTPRVRDENKASFRSRVFYDTYLKRHYAEDIPYGNGYDRKSPVLKREHTRSLGRSSEGSLHLSSGQLSSGFASKDFTAKDAVNRSCSLSCLTRGQSLTSVDQLSPDSLQHPLGSKRDFAQKSFRHQTKRTPLSSIAWNTSQTPEHPLYGDRLLRTQSLMEFGPAIEDTAPCIPQENAKYNFYKSNIDYRRGVPSATHSIFADKQRDSLCFDNQENNEMERNNWKPRYRYPSFRSRINLSRKSFPSGRMEEQLFRPDNAQLYNDDVFLASDSTVEGSPANAGEWQNPSMRKTGLWQQQWKSDAQIHEQNVDHPESVTDKLFSKHADCIQRHPAYGLSVPKNQTEFAASRQNRFTENAQTPSQTFVKHFQTKKNFKTNIMEKVRGPDQSDKVDSRCITEEALRHIPGQRESTTKSQISPPAPCSVGVSPLSLRSPPKWTLLRNRENIYLSNIHNKGQKNEDGCTVSHDLAQTPSSLLNANRTKSLIFQSEIPKNIMNNKISENIPSSVSRRGSDIFSHSDLPGSCTENCQKHNRFVKHATSNSITGSPSNSPPRSPKTYYTFPRKSASIDGNIVSEKLVSHAFRQVPYRSKIAMWDNLEMVGSKRIENTYSNKGDNITTHSPVDSSVNPSPKEVACESISQTQDSHLQLTQDPKHSLGDPSTILSNSEKADPNKTEISVFSEGEDKDAGNPLKQYKTTSTFTVSIEEDNVKYQELVSVYYTLPRKYPRMLCNLLLDDTEKRDPSLPIGNSLSTEKKYEVRINLATVAFPSILKKEEKANLPTSVTSPSSTQLNPNTSADATKVSSHVLNLIGEKAGASQLQNMTHCQEEAPTKAPERLLSSRLGSTGPLDGPKHSESEDKSLHAISNNNNLTATSSMYVQKDNHVHCLTSTEPPGNTSPHIPPSHLNKNDQERQCTAHRDVHTSMSSTEAKIRQDEVKGSASYLYHKIFKKGNELQSRPSTCNTLISETKVPSNVPKQALQVDAISPKNSDLLPNRSGLDYSNTEKEPVSQNFSPHKVCTSSQRPVENSADHQKVTPKDELTNTAKDLPDDSADENKLSSDCTKDKASDIEKRKNRSSIKNKLAAMYKTSRKFSSKKTVTSKSLTSNMFSQNDASLLEMSNPDCVSISSSIPELSQQIGNNNKNQNPPLDEYEGIMLDKTEKKKLHIHEGPSSFSSEIRRPFTNLCNQKWKSPTPSPKPSRTKAGTIQDSTISFPKEIIPKVHSNFQVCDDGLKNNNKPISRVSIAVPNQKGNTNVADSSLFPLPSNMNLNVHTNYSKVNIGPSQEVVFPKESGRHENIKQANRFGNPNQSCVETVSNLSKIRERHLSESSYIRDSPDPLVSGSNAMRPGGRHSRKFKSYSELLSCDENENWDAYDGSSRTLGSRRVMYPSIEFGIFGKEQQQTFLDNIKRSLTEGRLWSPCLLNNPRPLKDEEGFSFNRPEQVNLCFANRNISAKGASPKERLHIHEEDSASSSESDSDTTTDDEYYLNGNEKESEL